MNYLYGKSFVIPSLLLSLFLLNACVGEDPEAPVIESPTLLKWNENTPFEYQIDAVGAEPLEYVLSQSDDSHLFKLDGKTGVLTANQNFDFESPMDSDKFNLYELAIIVLDEHGSATSKDFLIKILDVAEYELSIAFPAPGSNVGTLADKIHVRGQLLSQGEAVDPSGDLSVMVNGKKAKFLNDGTGNWMTLIDISAGANSVTVEVMDDGIKTDSEVLEFDNSYIIDLRSLVTKTGESFYGFDLSEKALMYKSGADGEFKVMLSLAEVGSNCSHFNTLRDLVGTDFIGVICDQEDGTWTVTLLDTIKGTPVFSIPNIVIHLNEPIQIVDDQYLLYKQGGNSFALVELSTSISRTFDIQSENLNNDLRSGYFVDGSEVFVTFNGPGWENLASFNLPESSETESGPLVAQLTGDSILASGPAVSFKGVHYFIDVSRIDVLSGGNVESRPINYLGEGAYPLEYPSGIDLISQNDTSVILTNYSHRQLYKLDLISGDLQALPGPQPETLGNSWQSAMHPEHTQLVTYDPDARGLYKIDLSDYSLEESQDIGSHLNDQVNVYGQIDFDFSSDILYRHRVLDWGGIDGLEPLPVLMAYDVKARNERSLIFGDTLENYFSGPEGTMYRIGETIVTDQANILWFSAVILPPGDGKYEGVYSFNLDNGNIKTIWQLENADSVNYPDDPYLSSFSKFLNGVVLTEWNDGYVKVLDKSGAVQNLVEPLDPYWLTHEADVDEARELIYFDGYYEKKQSEDFSTPDYDSLEIVEYDIKKETSRIITKLEVGTGLPFGSMSLTLDQNRQNLVTPHFGRLMIIDTYTGDRVVKEIQ